jgi:hypothetical protein
LRSCPCVVLTLVTLAVACGKNAEEERFDEARAICNALVGQTFGEAKAQLGQLDALTSPISIPKACLSDLTQWNSRDTCPYDGVTEICDGSGWNFWSNDPDLCDGAGCVFQPDGYCKPVRCWYGCLVRYAADDVVPSDDPAIRDATRICASRFVSRQLNPPVH